MTERATESERVKQGDQEDQEAFGGRWDVVESTPVDGKAKPLRSGVDPALLRPSPLLISLISLFVLSLLACEGPPSASSLQEWSAQDHHSSDDDKGGPSGQQAPAARGASASDVPQLVELTWRQQCTSCHGPMGKGDGQMGPMLHAPDLSDPALQAKASDAELAAIIKGGRDKMPAFNLPDPVLQGLVARIRQLKGR